MFCGVLACCTHHPASPAAKPEVFLQLGHSNTVHAVTFSLDGRILASAGADGTVKIWDVAAQRELRTLIRAVPIDCIAFSPNRLFR
jgi:WD40 repeat protein